VRAWIVLLALVALSGGCRTALPAMPLPADDPRPTALLAAWRTHTEGRDGLRAVARLAVDAPGAGVGGDDLALRSKQRMWLSRPANLRIEVLGFLDTALAVLVTDGERYALLESEVRRFDEGPVYDELLWDAARMDLSPEEAVEVILGAPGGGAEWTRSGAWAVEDRVRIELADAAGRPRRSLEFGPSGELRALVKLARDGSVVWEARFDDFVELTGTPFARRVAVESATGRAELTLRNVELNPTLHEDLFRLSAPEGG
jgi:hypothetical protein